jgi:NAD(P)H-dependent FMN reductase
MDEPLKIAIILGSTRPGRTGAIVAEWFHQLACRRPECEAGEVVYELVDVADFELPMFDEPVPPAFGQYEHPHTKAWSEAIASFDGYIFVTAEYNHSIPGALKNAIDFLYHEWGDKAAGFVSYGVDANGVRAIEHLRLVMGELRVADVKGIVSLSIFDDFDDNRALTPRAHVPRQVDALLDQLLRWSGAMKTLREPALAS